jgi:hypothetical protein
MFYEPTPPSQRFWDLLEPNKFVRFENAIVTKTVSFAMSNPQSHLSHNGSPEDL